MKLDPKIRTLLQDERFDAIEDVWMSRIEDSPDDLGFFSSTLRGLLQRQQTERADLLLTCLRSTAFWAIVQTANFRLVPTHFGVLFTSLGFVLWTTYLSLIGNRLARAKN